MNESKSLRIRLPHIGWLYASTVFMVVLAVGVSFLFPYYQQWKAAKHLEALGVRVYAYRKGPEWFRDLLPNELSKALVRVDQVYVHTNGHSLVPSSLNVTEFTDRDLQHIGSFREMRTLYLIGTQISDAGLTHLSGLSSLTSLRLGKTKITDHGLVHLGGLSHLGYLDLSGTQISDNGLTHLAGLSNLRFLDLETTEITDHGLVHLAGLFHLYRLDLSGTLRRQPNGGLD